MQPFQASVRCVCDYELPTLLLRSINIQTFTSIPSPLSYSFIYSGCCHSTDAPITISKYTCIPVYYYTKYYIHECCCCTAVASINLYCPAPPILILVSYPHAHVHYHRHQVHDTCGAGDAFAGAFLVEFQRSAGDLCASLQAGCAAGTAAVQLVGGSSVPSFELLSATSSATPSSSSSS